MSDELMERIEKNVRQDIIPILVDLFDSQKGASKKAINKEQLVVLVSQLLSMGLTSQESELVAELLIDMLRNAQRDVSMALSKRIANMDQVPLRLLMFMVDDGIELARTVLRQSPVFNDQDLIYIIKGYSEDYWREIAQRDGLGSDVFDALVKTRDVPTALYLSKNNSFSFNEDQLETLVLFSERDESILGNLLHRSEVSHEIFNTIYEGVSKALQHYIHQEFPDFMSSLSFDDQGQQDADLSFDEVPDDIDLQEGQESPDVRVELDGGGYRILAMKDLLQHIKCKRYDQYFEDMAAYADLTQPQLNSILADQFGKGLAVVCKAVGVAKTDFMSMFILLRSYYKGTKKANPDSIRRAARYYDQIHKANAAFVLRKVRRGEIKFS